MLERQERDPRRAREQRARADRSHEHPLSVADSCRYAPRPRRMRRNGRKTAIPALARQRCAKRFAACSHGRSTGQAPLRHCQPSPSMQPSQRENQMQFPTPTFPRRPRGFTLIEAMITVAIVAILGAIAYPNYVDYITRGRIIEGTSKLSDFRVRMEQYFMDNRTYVGPSPPGVGTCGASFTLSANDKFQIT